MRDFFKVVCAAQVEEHVPVFDDGGQFQGLCVDRELVLAKLDDVLTVNIQFVLVSQLADGIFTNGF